MNLIAPLEGLGLITLLVFSIFVLQEKITKLELGGIILITLGTILINVKVTDPVTLVRDDLNLAAFGIGLGITIILTVLLFLIVFRKSKILTGVILGISAGCFMAFQTLAKRITDISGLTTIFTFVMFAFAIATLGLTQWALVKTRANIVVPCFTSASIILTTILGIVVIDESIFTIQIGGIACIVMGIILMNLTRKEPTSESDIIEETVTANLDEELPQEI
jgi:multidrug transporter EmrE-like cation transporter